MAAFLFLESKSGRTSVVTRWEVAAVWKSNVGITEWGISVGNGGRGLVWKGHSLLFRRWNDEGKWERMQNCCVRSMKLRLEQRAAVRLKESGLG